MEEAPLVKVPGCPGGHSLCAVCLRRVWMGCDELPAAPDDVVAWTMRNRELIQHRQTCPCCRAGDGRSAADRLAAIRNATCDTTSLARAVVIVGLTMAVEGGI